MTDRVSKVGSRRPSRQRIWHLIGAFLCAALSLVTTRVAAQSTPAAPIVIANIAHGQEIDLIQQALRNAYQALGMTVRWIELPAARALIESNSGHIDGELARIGDIEDEYRNLRRVNVVLFTNLNAVFIPRENAPKTLEFADLAELGSVGILRGYKVTEKITRGLRNIQPLTSYDSAVRMLERGRINAFFGRSEDVISAMRTAGIPTEGFASFPIMRVPLYHYLNARHVTLLPALEAELNHLKGRHASVLDAMKDHEPAR